MILPYTLLAVSLHLLRRHKTKVMFSSPLQMPIIVSLPRNVTGDLPVLVNSGSYFTYKKATQDRRLKMIAQM
jgi:hypothetical protein